MALAKLRRLGLDMSMVRVFALVLSATGTLGCLGFGGPLIDEGSGEQADTEQAESADETGSEEGCGPSTAVVERVIDGDTVVLESGERVRYILIDTPEITNGKNECWGTQASEYNSMLVLGKTVTLIYDAECEDQYGRLLAYLEVDDLEINRELIATGQGCVLHIPPNGNAKVDEYRALEDAAKQAGLGMWGACGTIFCD
jgi:micrococcal nuclease